MSQIAVGSFVLVEDSMGRKHRKIAISPPTQGVDIPIVWVCRPEEWEASRKEGREAEGVPWPIADVEASQEGPSDVLQQP
jgi:hypothetical protein